MNIFERLRPRADNILVSIFINIAQIIPTLLQALYAAYRAELWGQVGAKRANIWA